MARMGEAVNCVPPPGVAVLTHGVMRRSPLPLLKPRCGGAVRRSDLVGRDLVDAALAVVARGRSLPNEAAVRHDREDGAGAGALRRVPTAPRAREPSIAIRDM